MTYMLEKIFPFSDFLYCRWCLSQIYFPLLSVVNEAWNHSSDLTVVTGMVACFIYGLINVVCYPTAFDSLSTTMKLFGRRNLALTMMNYLSLKPEIDGRFAKNKTQRTSVKVINLFWIYMNTKRKQTRKIPWEKFFHSFFAGTTVLCWCLISTNSFNKTRFSVSNCLIRSFLFFNCCWYWFVVPLKDDDDNELDERSEDFYVETIWNQSIRNPCNDINILLNRNVLRQWLCWPVSVDQQLNLDYKLVQERYLSSKRREEIDVEMKCVISMKLTSAADKWRQ